MPKAKLEKHTVRLRPGDVEFLRDRFPRLGANALIRKFVSDAVDRLQKPLTEEELTEIDADG